MTDYTAYFNGEYVPYSQVKIDPGDRGFSLGDVVFDTGRTFDGVPFRLKEHIDRLYRSLTYVRIDAGVTHPEMIAITEEVLRRNEEQRGSRRLHLHPVRDARRRRGRWKRTAYRVRQGHARGVHPVGEGVP